MIIRSYKVRPFLIPVLFVLLAGILFYSLFSAADRAEEAAAGKILPIYSVDNGGSKEIALTVNCAWGAEDIPELLALFREYRIKCTFFVLGVWAEKNPEAVKQIRADGHEIANHSYSHKLPSKSSEKQIREEIAGCSDAVFRITGSRPRLYRAPSGDYNEAAIRAAEELGMTAVQWSVDSLDWMKGRTREEIVNRVTGRVTSGSILLFHNDTEHTVEALPEVISHLQKEGYRFVPVSDLLLKGSRKIDANGVQRAF